METKEELTSSLAALQRRSSEELAAFIVSLLCNAPPGVRSYAEAFIAAGEPDQVAIIVRREIGGGCANFKALQAGCPVPAHRPSFAQADAVRIPTRIRTLIAASPSLVS